MSLRNSTTSVLIGIEKEFIKEIYAREGCDGLFEGYDYDKVRTEMKKLKSGKPSTSVHHFNLNVLRQHWKKNMDSPKTSRRCLRIKSNSRRKREVIVIPGTSISGARRNK